MSRSCTLSVAFRNKTIEPSLKVVKNSYAKDIKITYNAGSIRIRQYDNPVDLHTIALDIQTIPNLIQAL